MVTKDVKQISEVDIGSTKEDVSDDPKEMAKRFKKSFSREVRVHFVGAWSVLVCLIFHHSNSSRLKYTGILYLPLESFVTRFYPGRLRV